MQSEFSLEQSHLSKTYSKLVAMEEELERSLEETQKRALEDKKLLFDEMTRDFSSDIALESLSELEATNRIIQSYNLSADIGNEKLQKLLLLLKQPYFAKISLVIEASGAEKEIYIGAAGMTDDSRRHFIVDWRSPVAEVYYNQGSGPTSYEANGKTIHVDLKLRRQFDIVKDCLKAYFDTTIAIEDPLLLAALAKGGNPKLSAITTSIQKEQNKVIRHEDCPALLVQGIAGSGKTSVLLQRIAYLFYKHRDNLKPKDVYLITPNKVFEHYIDAVLPDMGESNPNLITWDGLMEAFNLTGRGLSKNDSIEVFESIDAKLAGFKLQPEDICDIILDGERVIAASSVRASLKNFKSIPLGTHLSALVIEELLDKLEQRIARLSKDEETQEKLFDLNTKEQLEIFGTIIFPLGDEELPDRTRRWLEWRYKNIPALIEDGAWLRLDRIGMRMLGKETLDASEWLYLKLAIVGAQFRNARYVMVDEVQDYTLKQLAVLARMFPNANFMLLGDENQALKKNGATFKEISAMFERLKRPVSQCDLMISYRCTPQITSLFCSLLPQDQRRKAESVRPDSSKPEIIVATNNYDDELALLAESMMVRLKEAKGAGLLAIITQKAARAQEIAELLRSRGDCSNNLRGCRALAPTESIPESGIIVLDVALAKGLEFHSVIVADGDSVSYPKDNVHRCRLYTALSRATDALAVIAKEELTPLLA